MAKILNVPHSHIKPDAEAPPPSQAASRPKNCQLSLDVLETLGVEIGGRDFVGWWQEYLTC
jgi:S-adenosylmethionine synthetase